MTKYGILIIVNVCCGQFVKYYDKVRYNHCTCILWAVCVRF